METLPQIAQERAMSVLEGEFVIQAGPVVPERGGMIARTQSDSVDR